MTFENCTVESFAFFLLSYNWLNHGNLLSLILLIAKIYSAKFAVFGLVNHQNLFQKNFHWPKFLTLRYWCLLIFGCWWLLEVLTNLITWCDGQRKIFFSLHLQLNLDGHVLFLAWCVWVWPLHGWVWMVAGQCDLFQAGCRWVWTFFGWVWVSVGESTVYNCPTFFIFLTVLYLLDSENQSFQKIVT